MKRLITYIAFTILVSTQVFAQEVKQLEAKKLLDEVSAKFKSLNSYRASFSLLMESSAIDVNETTLGDIIGQGDKFKLELKGEDPKEMYNNGSTIWTYFPDEEVTISDAEDEENEMFTVSNLVDMYKSGYKYGMEGTATVNGKPCQIVVLNPIIVNGQTSVDDIFKVRLFIDKKTKKIVKWKVFEKNGNRYTTTVTKFVENPSVSSNTFTFDVKAHKGIDINDMRE